MQHSSLRKHRSSASVAHGSSPTVAHTTSYQRASHGSSFDNGKINAAVTPSRIPRPPLHSPATTASYASSRSPTARRSNGSGAYQEHSTPLAAAAAAAGATSNSSRKRTRPMSPGSAQSHSEHAYYAASVAAISPFTPSAQGPAGWSYVTAAHIPTSPPPMVNVNYDLAGGMDTPSLVAARQYDALESDYLGDRISRHQQLELRRRSEDNHEDMLRGDKNGRGRGTVDDAEMIDKSRPNGGDTASTGWGGYVLGALGTVVAGAWEFCRKSAFQGFHAGGGQGYSVANGVPIDDEMNDSMWEDERDESLEQQQRQTTPSYSRSFSYERLPTPVPGRYPDDSPPPPPPTEDDLDANFLSPERRAPKRRQTSDGGDWTIVNKQKEQSIHHNGFARASSPRLSSPAAAPSSSRSRSHLRTQSATISRRSPITAVTARHHHRRRISSASMNGSPTSAASQSSAAGSRPHSSRHSLSTYHGHPHHQYHQYPDPTSPVFTNTSINTNNYDSNHALLPSTSTLVAASSRHTIGGTAPSPTTLSSEARRYVSRRRRRERETEQRYDQINDRLQQMIRQGKEALGTTVDVVAVVEDDDDDDGCR